jgi:hypothetical protein
VDALTARGVPDEVRLRSPGLPAAVLGKVVDSPEVSARFLWDFQRVRADLFAEGIGGHFRDLCEREGVALTTEPPRDNASKSKLANSAIIAMTTRSSVR